jgi:glycerol-3-phosphate dehydrogenase
MMTSIGLRVYDFLANVTEDDRRKMLDKEATLLQEPLLDHNTTLGSGYYSEYRTDDARLTIELLKKAAEFGATIINYCEMEQFIYDDNQRIARIKCRDHNTGNTFTIDSTNFVSATGPWVYIIRQKNASKNNTYLHLTKGVHVVFPFKKLPLQQSVYFDVPDGRMIFAIPRGQSTYVGTTDTDYFGDLERVVTTKADVNYLLDAVNGTFPDIHLEENDITSSWAGLRPLIHEEDKDPSELSRKDELFISDSGLISIAGGKLTGYRKMAQRTIDAVLKTMPAKDVDALKASFTATIALTSDAMATTKDVQAYEKQLALQLKTLGIENPYFAWYLTSTYGKQTDIILDHMKSFTNKNPELRLIRAELWYGIHYEMVNSLVDFFVRRTGRLFFDIASITAFKSSIAKDCAKYLNWDLERMSKELDTLAILVTDATHFYETELP